MQSPDAVVPDQKIRPKSASFLTGSRKGCPPLLGSRVVWDLDRPVHSLYSDYKENLV